MTAIVIIASLLFGWYWTATEFTSSLSGDLTVYVLAFILGLTTAAYFAIRSKQARNIIGAAVLGLNLLGSHLSWVALDPLANQMVLDTLTAMWFVFTGVERWQFGIAGVYALSVLFGLLTLVGVVPGYLERPPVFLAFSYPDLAALCGHVASITLGLASGDWGRRVRAVASSRPAFAGGSSLAMKVLRVRG